MAVNKRKLWEAMPMFITEIVVMVVECLHISQVTKLYTFIVCSFLYVNKVGGGET